MNGPHRLECYRLLKSCQGETLQPIGPIFKLQKMKGCGYIRVALKGSTVRVGSYLYSKDLARAEVTVSDNSNPHDQGSYFLSRATIDI